jgi:hypothetical protein
MPLSLTSDKAEHIDVSMHVSRHHQAALDRNHSERKDCSHPRRFRSLRSMSFITLDRHSLVEARLSRQAHFQRLRVRATVRGCARRACPCARQACASSWMSSPRSSTPTSEGARSTNADLLACADAEETLGRHRTRISVGRPASSELRHGGTPHDSSVPSQWTMTPHEREHYSQRRAIRQSSPSRDLRTLDLARTNFRLWSAWLALPWAPFRTTLRLCQHVSRFSSS